MPSAFMDGRLIVNLRVHSGHIRQPAFQCDGRVNRTFDPHVELSGTIENVLVISVVRMSAAKQIRRGSSNSARITKIGGGVFGKEDSLVQVKLVEESAIIGGKSKASPREDGVELEFKNELLVRNSRGGVGTVVGIGVGEREGAADISIGDEGESGLFKGNAVGDGIDLIVEEELILFDAMDGKVPGGRLGNTAIDVTNGDPAFAVITGCAVIVGTILARRISSRDMGHNVFTGTSNVAIFGPQFKRSARDFIESSNNQGSNSIGDFKAVDLVLSLPDLRVNRGIKRSSKGQGVTEEDVDGKAVGSGVGHVDAISTSTKTAENKAGFINDGFKEGTGLKAARRIWVDLEWVEVSCVSSPRLAVLIVINCHRKAG